MFVRSKRSVFLVKSIQMKIISGILTIGAGLFLVNRMGINTVGLFNLKKFSGKASIVPNSTISPG